MAPAHAVFEAGEHHARLARARRTLADGGFELAVVVAPEHLYWLAGYDSWVAVNSPQALVFATGTDAPPTIVVRDVDRPLVTETSWVEDVRAYRLNVDDPARLIADVAAEHGLADGAVAIETGSYALTHAWGTALAAALAPARLADATPHLGRLRWVKSPAEIALLRRAARFAGAGLDAARATLAPGISEIALAAEIEAAMRRAGSDFWAIPTELSSGLRSAGGHATPRLRTIRSGDLAHMEFAGVAERYHAVAISTMAAGTPSDAATDLYRLTRESLAAGIATLAPGVPAAAVETAAIGPLAREGLEDAFMMRFGYGIGIAYPPVWLETLQIARSSDQVLEPGMAFVLHAALALPDDNLGTIQGGTWLMTPDGAEMLVGPGDVPLEIV